MIKACFKLSGTKGARRLALALALALLAIPSAEAHRGGRGDHDRGSGRDRDFGGGPYKKPESTEAFDSYSPRLNSDKLHSDGDYDSDGSSDYDSDGLRRSIRGKYSDSPYYYSRDGYPYREETPEEAPAESAAEAQAEYFYRVAKYYRTASSKTLALGIVATAEGLGKKSDKGIMIGEGDTLIASGLKTLAAGEELKKAEEDTLAKIHAPATPKEVDEELMNDPLAEEVIAELVKKTGYSRAEVIAKILASKGNLDLLAEEFEAAAKRREQIDQAKLVSEAETAAIVDASKSGSLRKKINFASLREALTTSAVVAKKAAPALDWKKQWAKLAAQSPVMVFAHTKAKAPVTARAPASQPEFLNLGENLPSFELEQRQSEEAEEISLFEKVRRKYGEIAPAMSRLK